MQRDVLLLEEMVDAGRQAHSLATGQDADALEVDRLRSQPTRLRNRIVHGYWSIDVDLLLETAQHQLPAFVAQVEVVLAEVAEGPGGAG